MERDRNRARIRVLDAHHKLFVVCYFTECCRLIDQLTASVPSVSTMTLARATIRMNLWKCRNWYISRCYLIMSLHVPPDVLHFTQLSEIFPRIRTTNLERENRRCPVQDWYLSTDEHTAGLSQIVENKQQIRHVEMWFQHNCWTVVSVHKPLNCNMQMPMHENRNDNSSDKHR